MENDMLMNKDLDATDNKDIDPKMKLLAIKKKRLLDIPLHYPRSFALILSDLVNLSMRDSCQFLRQFKYLLNANASACRDWIYNTAHSAYQ